MKNGRQRRGAVMRLLLLAPSYLLFFPVLDWTTRLFETFPHISPVNLPAGLNLALLLTGGAPYTVLIFFAELAKGIWLRAYPAGLGDAAVYAGMLAIVYMGAANLVSRIMVKTGGRILSGNSLGLFLLGGLLTAVSVSLAATLNLCVTGVLSWDQFSEAFAHGCLGIGLGIVSMTPFLIVNIAPGLESILRGSSGQSLGKPDSPRRVRWEQATLGIFGGFAFLPALIGLVAIVPVEKEFLVFCLLLVPFGAAALLTGLRVVSSSVMGAALGSTLMLWNFGVQFQKTVEFQLLLLTTFLIALLVAAIKDEMKLVEQGLPHQNAVFGAVTYALETLGEVNDWDAYCRDILRRIGEAARAGHVYALEGPPKRQGGGFESLPYEWISPDFSLDKAQFAVLNRMRSRQITPEIAEKKIWETPPPDLTGEELALWNTSGIGSTLVLPIRLEQELWGYLALDRSLSQPAWTGSEIEPLYVAIRSLGSLLAGARTRQQTQRLLSGLPGNPWLSSPDGSSRVSLSRSQDAVESRIGAVHPEDAAKVKLAFTREDGFDLEYRRTLPDGSIRWIRDLGQPVRETDGQVFRVVGISEDITRRKAAEARRQSNFQLFKSSIDKLGIGVLIEDEDCLVRLTNGALLEMLGVSEAAEALQDSHSLILFGDSGEMREKIDEIRAAGEPITGAEIQFGDLTLKCDYIPLSVGGEEHCHLWQFRPLDVRTGVAPKMEESLREKERLLREIHDRVRNDLQIIYGLLNLQSSRISDPEVLHYFVADQARVRAMALVHDRLSKAEEIGMVDFPEYAKSLTDQLVKSYLGDSPFVRVKLEMDPVPMHIKTAIPCGLIINELVSNSLKYAFPESRRGEVLVRLSREGENGIRLVVQDDGVGLPGELDFQRIETLGFMLVSGLTEQLGGTISFRNNSGTEFDISFPLTGLCPQEPESQEREEAGLD